MTTNNLTVIEIDDAERARIDLEAAGVPVLAYEYDPATRTLRVTTPLVISEAQARAMRAGFRPSYITFRGPLS
jgi:hypothetical protein